MDQRVEAGWAAPVRVHSSLCSRYRSTRSRCTACAEVCPVSGALHMSEAGADVTAACSGCGACVAACPNGAVQAREDDAQLRQRMQVQPGQPLRIACDRAEGQADLVLGCLSRLTEAVMLAPIHAGASRVELLAPDCDQCEQHRAAAQWRRTAHFANALCETAGLAPQRVASVRAPFAQVAQAPLAKPPGSTQEPGRRALFRAIARRWEAADAVPPAAAPVPFHDIVQHHDVNAKRTDLLGLLPALAGAAPGARTRSYPARAADVPVAQPEVDAHCIGCNVCETLCPVGALSHRDQGARYALELDAARCTGCGVCVAVCYPQAIHLRETVDLALLFAPRRVTLFSAARRICAACGEPFVSDTAATCPSCRISGQRRESAARSLFTGVDQSEPS